MGWNAALESHVSVTIKRMLGCEDTALPEYESVGAAGMDVS
jgi:hypothetical protein